MFGSCRLLPKFEDVPYDADAFFELFIKIDDCVMNGNMNLPDIVFVIQRVDEVENVLLLERVH